MESLRTLLWVVSGLFAALTAYASLVQIRDPKYRSPCLLILAGCFALGFAVYVAIAGNAGAWIAALIGGAAICAGAAWNGKRCGNLQLKYHAFRLVMCALFVLGYAFL